MDLDQRCQTLSPFATLGDRVGIYKIDVSGATFVIFKLDAVDLDQGSISPTYLCTAFTPVAPKSVRIQSSCQYLFMLLGSTCAKAVCRTLMKLNPVVINVRSTAAHQRLINQLWCPKKLII